MATLKTDQHPPSKMPLNRTRIAAGAHFEILASGQSKTFQASEIALKRRWRD
jgi:hypothetical protein